MIIANRVDFYALMVPYFFSYKTRYFLPKQSEKSSSLGLFRKGKICILATFHRTDLVICSHSREGKPLYYSQINMIFHYNIPYVAKKIMKKKIIKK